MNAVIDFTDVKELLLRTCGHVFENGREQVLAAVLGRRMAALGIDAYAAYHALLLRDSAELLRLTESLTINETYFFREPEHLNLMVDTLLPELLATRSQRPVRILSAGCSTGEEPYSIAIMLRERFGEESERLFSITGVDIDSMAIAGARRGLYGNASFRNMDKAMVERYFSPGGPGKFQVGTAVRKQVEFAVVNLLETAYPQCMQLPDVILYRNVSIYFPQPVQREIFGKLAGLLVDGGSLLVGASETFHHDIGILSLVKQASIFFYRKTPTIVFQERRTAQRHQEKPAPLRNATGQVVADPVAGTKAGQPQVMARPVNAHHGKPPRSATLRDVRSCFDLALELARNRKPAEALRMLDDIIEQDESFSKAHILKGNILLSESRFDEAGSVCETVLGRDPLCLEAYLILGLIARHNGNDLEAFRRFREALYLDACCWVAHFYTAEILFEQREVKRARKSYESALKILERGSPGEHGRDFFPLAFNTEHFTVVCRHKLSLLKVNG